MVEVITEEIMEMYSLTEFISSDISLEDSLTALNELRDVTETAKLKLIKYGKGEKV